MVSLSSRAIDIQEVHMKKGIILALVLCVLATGIVYAGKVSISAQITPYSLQLSLK